MPENKDRMGQQLGNYRLVRLLGEGAFAEVYLGEHIHLGRQAAIKVLHTQLTQSQPAYNGADSTRRYATIAQYALLHRADNAGSCTYQYGFDQFYYWLNGGTHFSNQQVGHNNWTRCQT